MNKDIDTTPLDKEGARRLTEELRTGFDSLGKKLLEAYTRRAFKALGYSTFVDYADAELNLSRSRAYKALDEARVSSSLLPELGEEVVRKIPGSQKEVLIEVPVSERVGLYKEAQKTASENGVQITTQFLKKIINKKKKEEIDPVPEKKPGVTVLPRKSTASNRLDLSSLKNQLKAKTRELANALIALDQAREEITRLQTENERLQGLLASTGLTRD